jgi:pSer/pThr/pTyr-binding forkhead associated (FHA) protein
VTVGRADTNDIVVANTLVSRLHACFQELDGAWFLVDAESKNGTWLNGVPLLPFHKSPLGIEATISLGGLQVQFFIAERLAAYLSGPVQSTPGSSPEE